MDNASTSWLPATSFFDLNSRPWDVTEFKFRFGGILLSGVVQRLAYTKTDFANPWLKRFYCFFLSLSVRSSHNCTLLLLERYPPSSSNFYYWILIISRRSCVKAGRGGSSIILPPSFNEGNWKNESLYETMYDQANTLNTHFPSNRRGRNNLFPFKRRTSVTAVGRHRYTSCTTAILSHLYRRFVWKFNVQYL